MGEKTKEILKLQFDKRLRLEFHGARITSDDHKVRADGRAGD